MASEEVPIQNAKPLQLLSTTLLAQHTQLVQIKWKPSDGYNSKHLQWARQLKQLARANGILPNKLEEKPPPQLSAVATRTTATDPQVQQQLQRRDDWLLRNSALYWDVLLSLDLDGPDAAAHQRAVDDFVEEELADGRGLVRWAMAFANLGTEARQSKLLLDFLQMKLKEGSTCEQTRHSGWT